VKATGRSEEKIFYSERSVVSSFQRAAVLISRRPLVTARTAGGAVLTTVPVPWVMWSAVMLGITTTEPRL
jgi:hypothetical protein